METNNIYFGKENLLDTLSDKSIDGVILDLSEHSKFISSYQYWEWFCPIYMNLNRVLKDGGFFASYQSENYFRYLWDWFGVNIQLHVAVNYTKNNYVPVVVFYKNLNKKIPTYFNCTAKNTKKQHHNFLTKFITGTALNPFINDGSIISSFIDNNLNYIGFESDEIKYKECLKKIEGKKRELF